MSTYRSQRRPPTPPRGVSPQVMAIGVIALILAVVLALFMAMSPKDEPSSTATQENPFGDLEEEGPTKPTRRGTTGGDEPSPFEDVSLPDDDPVWLEAKRKGERGLALIREAVAAKDAGDRETARAKAAEARTLLEQADAATLDFEQSILARYGPNHRFVKLVQKRTKKWRSELIALKKGGL